MERLTFERSRAKSLLLAAASAGLIALGWLFAHNATETFHRLIGWSSVAFFGLTLLVGLKRAIQGGVAFAFDRSGVTVAGDDIGVIPWSEVASCSVVNIHGNRMLSLTFREPERFLARVSPAKRKVAALNANMGWGHWTASFAGISPGIDSALRFIRDHVPDVPISE